MGVVDAGFLDFACRMARVSNKSRRLLQLRHCEGYTDQAIAAEFGDSLNNVRTRACRALKKLREYAWSEDERRQLTAAMESRGDAAAQETVMEHARGVAVALRNSRQSRSSAPEVDEAGRTIGGHAPLIGVEDIYRIITGRWPWE